jgi:hypothetical protein
MCNYLPESNQKVETTAEIMSDSNVPEG